MKHRALSFEFLDALVTSGVPAAAMRVAIVIGRFQGQNESAWPNMDTIRSRAGADVRTVQRAIADLENAKLLTKIVRPGRSNEYSLRTPGKADGTDVLVGGDTNAPATPGTNAPATPAQTPPAPGIPVVPHLTLEHDHLNTISESVSATEDLQALAFRTLIQGFERRWRAKRDRDGKPLGAMWPGFGPHRGKADDIARAYAGRADELDATLEGYFASTEPFVMKVRWNFATYASDPGRWLTSTGYRSPSTSHAPATDAQLDALFGPED